MRSAGVDERYCTGRRRPRTRSSSRGQRRFQSVSVIRSITGRISSCAATSASSELLDPSTAPRIWEAANQQLREGAADRARHPASLRRARSTRRTIPRTSLDASRRDPDCQWRHPRVLPTFRPDGALQVDCAGASRRHGSNGSAQRGRRAHHLAAHTARCTVDDGTTRFTPSAARLSDHGLPHCFASPCSEHEADAIFQQRAATGRAATPDEHAQFASFMMRVLRPASTPRRGWTKQLHLGARRNVNTRMAAHDRPRHRIRLDWRLAAGRSARPPTSIASNRRTRCRT